MQVAHRAAKVTIKPILKGEAVSPEVPITPMSYFPGQSPVTVMRTLNVGIVSGPRY
jgi:hypothetical protein